MLHCFPLQQLGTHENLAVQDVSTSALMSLASCLYEVGRKEAMHLLKVGCFEVSNTDVSWASKLKNVD